MSAPVGSHRKRWSRSLERAQETRPIRSSGRVEHQRDANHTRRDCLEQVEPFPAHRVLEARETRYVAARTREARDDTLAERIGDPYEHDWCPLCLLPQGSHRERATRQDDLRWQPHHFSRIGLHLGSIGARITIFD